MRLSMIILLGLFISFNISFCKDTGSEKNISGPFEKPIIQNLTQDDLFLNAIRQGDTAKAESLLKEGANVQAKDSLGSNAVLLAVRWTNELNLVRSLIQKGASVDVPDNQGRTPLSWAAEKNRIEILKYLVSKGAKIDSKDTQGRTPLFHACLSDSRSAVSYLLTQRANVNSTDSFGDTSLMMAATKDYQDLAKLLLSKGANAKIKDQEGRMAVERLHDQPEMEKILRSYM